MHCHEQLELPEFCKASGLLALKAFLDPDIKNSNTSCLTGSLPAAQLDAFQQKNVALDERKLLDAENNPSTKFRLPGQYLDESL